MQINHDYVGYCGNFQTTLLLLCCCLKVIVNTVGEGICNLIPVMYCRNFQTTLLLAGVITTVIMRKQRKGAKIRCFGTIIAVKYHIIVPSYVHGTVLYETTLKASLFE
jgi:hypothetical protein